jgi:hypothetical protein
LNEKSLNISSIQYGLKFFKSCWEVVSLSNT